MTGAADPEAELEPGPGTDPLPLLQFRERLRRISGLSLVMLLVFGVFAGFYTSQQNGQRLDDALHQLTESDKQRAASDADRKKLLILVNAQNNAIAALQDQLRQLGAVPVVPGAPTTPASPGPIPPTAPAPAAGEAPAPSPARRRRRCSCRCRSPCRAPPRARSPACSARSPTSASPCSPLPPIPALGWRVRRWHDRLEVSIGLWVEGRWRLPGVRGLLAGSPRVTCC
jgi:hypothetical protein